MLGARTGPLLLIPGLLIYRFVWSDALAASNTPPSPLDLKISNWLFWIGLGLVVVLAYVL